MATTWNPGDKNPFTVLSNGNLTASGQDIGGPQPVRASTGITTGKRAFALTINRSGAMSFLVGVANPSCSVTDYHNIGTGGDTDATILNVTYDEVYNGSYLGGGPAGAAIPDGGVVLVLVDADTREIRFKYGSATTGAYPAPAGTLYPIVAPDRPALAATINPSPTGLPAGYSTWDAAVGLSAEASNLLGAIGVTAGTSVIVRATGALALAPITAAGAAAATVKAQAAIQIPPIAATATAFIAIYGNSETVLGELTVASAGVARLSAAAGITIDPVSTGSAARSVISGNASAALGAATLSAAGAGQAVNGGALTASLGGVAVASSAQITVRSDAIVSVGSVIMASGSAAPVTGSAGIHLGTIATGGGAVVRLHGQVILSLGGIGTQITATKPVPIILITPPERRAMGLRISRRVNGMGRPPRSRTAA